MPKQLRKYSKTVYRNKSGLDTAQVPASATLTVYRQGATASAAKTVSDTTTDQSITVFDIGRVEVGDTLQLESDIVAGNSTPTVTVDLITPPNTIRVDSDSNGDFVVAADDRLVVTNAKPTLYDESTGVSTLASLTTSATTGLAECYIAERFVDVLVAGSGLTSVLLADEATGEAGGVVNGSDYPTLQDALDSVPDGGTLYIPGGTWNLSTHGSSGTLTIDPDLHQNGITIYGDGWGTELVAQDANTHAIKYDISGKGSGSYSNIVIRDLRITGPASAGTGHGIYFVADTSTPGALFNQINLSNINVASCGSDGMRLEGLILASIVNCQCQTNKGNGIYLEDPNWVTMIATYCKNNDDCGLQCRTAGGAASGADGVEIIGCAFEANQQDQTAKSDSIDAQLYCATGRALTIRGSDFEDFTRTTSKTAIILENYGSVSIMDNQFFETDVSEDGSSRSIYVASSGGAESTYIFIGCNYHYKIAKSVKVDSTAQNVIVFPQQGAGGASNVVDLPTGTNADGVGIVQIRDGVRVPQWTAATVPAAAAANAGMIIYVRDAGTNATKFQFSDGSSWLNLGS